MGGLHDEALPGLAENLGQARDRDDQIIALANPSIYNDSIRRNLRSDEARAFKRLTWAKEAFAQLKKGTAPSCIIDPETDEPLDPEAQASPVRKRAPAAAPASPPTPDDDPSPAPPRDLPEFPEGCPVEDKESLMLAAELLRPIMAAARAAKEASGPKSSEWPSGSKALLRHPRWSPAG